MAGSAGAPVACASLAVGPTHSTALHFKEMPEEHGHELFGHRRHVTRLGASSKPVEKPRPEDASQRRARPIDLNSYIMLRSRRGEKWHPAARLPQCRSVCDEVEGEFRYRRRCIGSCPALPVAPWLPPRHRNLPLSVASASRSANGLRRQSDHFDRNSSSSGFLHAQAESDSPPAPDVEYIDGGGYIYFTTYVQNYLGPSPLPSDDAYNDYSGCRGPGGCSLSDDTESGPGGEEVSDSPGQCYQEYYEETYQAKSAPALGKWRVWLLHALQSI